MKLENSEGDANVNDAIARFGWKFSVLTYYLDEPDSKPRNGAPVAFDATGKRLPTKWGEDTVFRVPLAQ